jgi:hypothetical protein
MPEGVNAKLDELMLEFDIIRPKGLWALSLVSARTRRIPAGALAGAHRVSGRV